MSFIQNLFTSRDNNANSATYVGQQDRLWWDPVTNQFYYSNGNTPGGFPVGGGGGNGTPGGSNSQVQFNQAGNFGGSANLTFNSVTGSLTAVSFVGNGVGLTSITGANVTGTVANATFATSAGSATTATTADTANSVAGANVSGTVANATFATSATSATTAGTVTTEAQSNITSVGILTSMSSTGNVTANYFLGNGSQLTGLLATYGNANVVANLAAFATNPISTTGNVTAGYFIGNGSLLTSVAASYGNANVDAYLPIYTGNLIALQGNVITTANIQGNYILGNAAFMTGIPASYGNANVVANLSALGTNPISTTGNITGNYFIGNGSLLTGVVATSIGTLPSLSVTGNTVTGNLNALEQVSAVGNITGGNILFGTFKLLGTGDAQVGNLTVSNGPGTGNIVAGNIISATGNILSGSNISAVANVIGGNLLAGSGVIVTTGNITGGNILAGSGVISTGGNVNGSAFNGNVAFTTGTVSGSGNITGGNVVVSGVLLSTNTVSAAGNVTGGNINTGGNVSTSGNVIAADIRVGTGITGGTISALGNITSANTLNTVSLSLSGNVVSALNITGNVTGGNINSAGIISTGGNILGQSLSVSGGVTAGSVAGGVITGTSVSVSANVTGGNVNTNTIIGTGVTINSANDLNLSATGNVVINNKYLNGVLTPVQDSDAANKLYVDTVAQGLDAKSSVHTATTAALPAYTYNNGTSGVGATLTGTATGTLTVAGDTILLNQRVLVKDETGAFVNNTTMSAAFNGIYLCTTEGAVDVAFVLTRATDFNTAAEMYSAFVFVETGTGIADTGWVCTNNIANPIIVGTTQITFVQFSGAGTYSANTAAGLLLTGSVFSAKTDNITTTFDGSGNIIVKASAQLTTPNIGAAIGTSVSVTGNIATSANFVGNGAALTGIVSSYGNANVAANLAAFANNPISTTGNVTAGYFVGNGSLLSSITAANVVGTVANATFATSAGSATTATTATTAGTVTSNAQANITSVGILTSLSSTGNITGGNVLGGANVNATTHTGTTVSVSGNITGGNVLGGANVNSTLFTGTTVSVTGTITGASVVGGVITGSSVSVTGNITGGNVLGGANVNATTHTGTTVSVSGNITGGNVLGGANVNATTHTGTTVSVTGNITGAGHIGTIYTNSIINTGANLSGNIGSATGYFNTVFAKATSAQYADLAELYQADADYNPGTVLIFGGEQEVTAQLQSHSTAIAGVVSENPSHLMNAGLEGEHVAAVALLGRVSCQVQGTIRKGDLLVASDTAGVAQRLDINQYQPGCVIGKSLANYDSDIVGTIEIAVGIK